MQLVFLLLNVLYSNARDNIMILSNWKQFFINLEFPTLTFLNFLFYSVIINFSLITFVQAHGTYRLFYRTERSSLFPSIQFY